MDAATRRLLILVQLCFGVFPALGKIAMPTFSPEAVLVWRLLVGSGVLMALALARHGRAALPPAAELLRLFGLALLGVIVNQFLFLEGLSRTTSVNAGLLITVIPVATTAIAVLLRRERATARRLGGIGLAVAGVALLFLLRLVRRTTAGGSTALGDLFIVVNAISYSFYLVLAKGVLSRLPQLVVVAWLFVFGALVMPWFALDITWVPPAAQPVQWWALAGILLFPTVLAYLLNTIVLARTHASTTAAYVMLQPFVAMLLGLTLLREEMHWSEAVTGAFVLAGLWLVSVPPRAPAAA
ncbi:MAG TPA: DMT family transporter [Planctomycetota bacterium]|nr:DMT family transporter [Planctomycetota bacterium]